MQKMLLNNSDQSLRLISMNKYHELRGQRVDRRCVRLREDWNKNVLTLCWEKWKKEGKKKKIKQEDVNVHAVLYWLLNVKWNKNQKQKMASTSALTHTCAPAHTHTHTRMFRKSLLLEQQLRRRQRFWATVSWLRSQSRFCLSAANKPDLS